MNLAADTRPAGTLGLQVLRAQPEGWPARELTLAEIARYGMAQPGLPAAVNTWRRANRLHLARGLRRVLAARALRLPHFYGQLFLTVLRAGGHADHLGLASLRVVTTAGVRFICDDFNAGGTDVSNMKFHALGTGTNAEAAADTALQTELTTQYQTDNTRPTGSQASATVSANATYTTVGTVTVDAAVAATEHGIFSASSAGTLLDRSVFSVVNLASGDSLQATYVLTLNSGG
ncbi:MAG TPA: hypothetical protein VJ966_03555 [Actinomycetes bacterium]|nr:hypothetical protein [Actinomycetes bacterium]